MLPTAEVIKSLTLIIKSYLNDSSVLVLLLTSSRNVTQEQLASVIYNANITQCMSFHMTSLPDQELNLFSFLVSDY